MTRSGLVVLVCGGRSWDDRVLIWSKLAELRRRGYVWLVHGACRGADRIAGEEGRRLGFRVREVPARWDLYGRGAGMRRNVEMLKYRPDLVLAFHEDLKDSRGTAHMVRLAQEASIPVRVVSRTNPRSLAFLCKERRKETLYVGGES